MKQSGNDFVPVGYPYIIVSKLTHEIIRAAIQEFIDAEEDSYWLKLYHIPELLPKERLKGKFDIDVSQVEQLSYKDIRSG